MTLLLGLVVERACEHSCVCVYVFGDRLITSDMITSLDHYM